MAILAAVDSSERSERVVRFAIEEAKLRGEKLILIHCIEPVPKPRTVEEDITEFATKVGEELLSTFVSRAREEGVDCESILVEEVRNPENSIVEIASEVEPTLIVIGVRKRSPVGKLLFGSTAQHVILHAEQPVVCVK